MPVDTLLDIAMVHADTTIENAQRGDEKALNRLVSLWYKRIYNYVHKYHADHDIASDLAQKTFIQMFKHISKLKDADRFKPWLYRIATNLCFEESRQKKRNKLVSIQEGGDEDEVNVKMQVVEAKGNFFNPERSFQQEELAQALISALNELSEDQRSVVIMKEYEGLKFTEIAEALNASENTVKTWMYRGLKNLRVILEGKKITKETVHYEL